MPCHQSAGFVVFSLKPLTDMHWVASLSQKAHRPARSIGWFSLPSGVTVQTRWSCMSENHSLPLCHLGPSAKQRLSSRIVMTNPQRMTQQDTVKLKKLEGENLTEFDYGRSP